MNALYASRAYAILDAKALRHNLAIVKKKYPQSPIIAMIKANAYGHGAEAVSHILKSEVDMFGVACLREAKFLRANSSECPILIMGGVFSCEEWPEIFDLNCNVVLHHAWQIESLCNRYPTLPKDIFIWLKIDTGMHRLGFTASASQKIIQKLMAQYPSLSLGLMTHFACADELDNPLTLNQWKVFNDLNTQLKHTLKLSVANSAAILEWPHINSAGMWLRPGIMLYGISPFLKKTGQELGLKPVMTLQSHIISIQTCYLGEGVGYNSTWRAQKESLIAVVAIGYGDGYPRHVQNAKVWIKDRFYPIVGNISMDMLTVDISDSSEVLTIGECVELWGEHLPVEHVAAFANTSPYEIITQVHQRVLD